jgi:hypothetical protein
VSALFPFGLLGVGCRVGKWSGWAVPCVAGQSVVACGRAVSPCYIQVSEAPIWFCAEAERQLGGVRAAAWDGGRESLAWNIGTMLRMDFS